MTRTVGRALLSSAALAALAAAVACGGGGGGSSSSSPPGVNAPVAATSHASFTIAIPAAAGSSSTQRAPAYVSPNSQSVAITVAAGSASPGPATTANLTSTSPNCTPATATVPLTCTVSLYAPPGSDTFTVTLYSGLNGTGNVLSTSTVAATVSATQTTNVPITLGGVVAAIAVSVTNGNNLIPGGYATTLPVVVMAKDAGGSTIVGPGNYSNPITLTNADTSGVTTLSTTSVTSPSTAVTLAYAPTNANTGVLAIGGLPVGATSIGAAAAGVASSAVTAGTFQYIADRFFGYNHARTLGGTATVVTTTYNAQGTPSPSPSTWSYTTSDVVTVLANATFNGITTYDAHHAVTYTQTSPATAIAPETISRDQYRFPTLNATGAIFYRYGETETDVNSAAVTSPITGTVPGTVTYTYTYPTTGAWEEDVLPHVNGATWNDNAVPFTEAYTNAEVATFTYLASGAWTFNETTPAVINESQSATGTATNFNAGVTTTISLPVAATPPGSGYVIPVAQETTSPAPGPTSTYFPVDWYPGNAAPVQPLYFFAFSETNVTIPASCNVPASIATQAYAVNQQNSQLDVAAFRNRQQVFTDYYVPGGVGYVCETYTETTSNYRFPTGIISNQTSITYVFGVASASALSVRRQ